MFTQKISLNHQETSQKLKQIIPLIVLFVILTLGWWVVPSQIESIPLCPMKFFFHIDCPGCGLTRSFLSIARGHLLAAFSFNPAGLLIYPVFLVYFIELLIRFFKSGFYIRLPILMSRMYGLCVLIVLLANWFYKLHEELKGTTFFY